MLVCRIKARAIDFKENFGDRRRHTLISINKSMCLREVISISCSASGEISVLVIFTILHGSKRGRQRAFITQAGRAAESFYDLNMNIEHFMLT